MNSVPDFEDMLALLNEHQVRYLIIGGLAFIFHAKPRYTKDMDLWVEGTEQNITRANRALAEFGSPVLLEFNNPEQVVQIGVAPNRIDIIVNIERIAFNEAWEKRVESPYGGGKAFWIDLESLWRIKSAINHPRHQEDARVLRRILEHKHAKNKSTMEME
jgi:plasmid maintenance system antidote protein VapI